MSLVSDIINEAFLDLGVIAPGESISASMQTDAFLRLNQLLGTLSDEGATVFNQVMQTFSLQPNVYAYTLGAAGTWPTAGNLRAQRVTSWLATYNNMRKGGPALPMAQFGAAADAAQMELAALYQRAALEGIITSVPLIIQAPIPTLLAADTAYPLINVRVYPAPAYPAGQVELAYWVPLTSFVTVGDTVSLPTGWEDMLHFNLAVRLAPQYARATGITQELAANAQNSKASIVSQNNMQAQVPPPPAPQAQ
jgi:hypothetical protein